MKTMKRLLMDNTGTNGALNGDEFMAAILQYRNTPDSATGISPAMYTFHRQLRDFLPDPNIGNMENWENMKTNHQVARENQLTKHQARLHEHTRRLAQLQVGTRVFVQNQTGGAPNKWDLTGQVVEVKQHDQYVIKLDHSGRHTLRNRKYIRVWKESNRTPQPKQIPPVPEIGMSNRLERHLNTPQEKETPCNLPADVEPTTTPQPLTTEVEHQDKAPPRRSYRNTKQPDRLQYTKLGTPE